MKLSIVEGWIKCGYAKLLGIAAATSGTVIVPRISPVRVVVPLTWDRFLKRGPNDSPVVTLQGVSKLELGQGPCEIRGEP